ncbi:MAG: serine protease [Bacteroidaceae bacterium]|nr:serine protease [Bacteroidaceae bacterium]
MYRRILFSLIFFATVLAVMGQQPKWYKKARKAQLTVLTYDSQGQLLHSTNGFFISPDGQALSDYASFRHASRAVVVDEGGRQYDVKRICGASSLYDVVCFKVDIKKTESLAIAATASVAGDVVTVLPYISNKSGACTQTTVSEVQVFNEQFPYYTLPITLAENNLSCPVMNEQGEVVGLWQMSATRGDEKSYAVSAAFAASLSTTALSANNNDLREILIPKALPADAAQASSFIYLTGTRDTSLYLTYVSDFIELFPNETNGYTMKAEMLAAMGRYAEADAVWNEGLKAHAAADELHYSRSRSIYAVAQDTASRTGWTLDDALTEIVTAKDINPLPLYTALEGHILYALQRYADASERFEQVCASNLRSAEQFLYAAQCRQMMADTLGSLALQDSAVACFTKPYRTDAAPALLMRATTYLSLHRYREAVGDLLEYEYVSPNPLNANFYYQRSQAALKCRMFQQALSDLEQAVRKDNGEPLFQAELAALHYRFGNYEEAELAARKAVALDAEFADAHRILGVCLKAQGKDDESKASLQRAAELGDEMARQMLAQ